MSDHNETASGGGRGVAVVLSTEEYGLLRREQQVNVIGHQHVGVQPAPLTRQCFTEPAEVGGSVLVFKKARCPVVAALDTVQRQTVDVNP